MKDEKEQVARKRCLQISFCVEVGGREFRVNGEQYRLGV